MNSNVIPFGIDVNPIRHTHVPVLANHNADMDYKTTEGQAIVKLAREKKLEVFDDTGRLKETELARILSRGAGTKIHQSTLTRLLKGELSGKEKTLQPFADGFGITYIEFISRIRPSTAAPAVSVASFPPEAVDLWKLWRRVPAKQRDWFLEQLKAAAEFAEKYPELTAVVNEPASQAATEIRLGRQRQKKSGG